MKKSGNMRKMLTYYKPYMRVFWTDMFFQRGAKRNIFAAATAVRKGMYWSVH